MIRYDNSIMVKLECISHFAAAIVTDPTDVSAALACSLLLALVTRRHKSIRLHPSDDGMCKSRNFECTFHSCLPFCIRDHGPFRNYTLHRHVVCGMWRSILKLNWHIFGLVWYVFLILEQQMQHFSVYVKTYCFRLIRVTGVDFKDVCMPTVHITDWAYVHSAECCSMLVLRTRTQFGWWSFHIAAPSIWNSLATPPLSFC